MADGKFFLGKDSEKGDTLGADFYYKADQLTTHAMILGMTGSGKTGLCLDLAEEAILEDIPLIIIDPKGDIANLALLFPEFRGADFQPWISPLEAEQKGITPERLAEETAEKWKKGLESWGISHEMVRQAKDKAEIRIFTPGSSAALQVNILEGFQKPAVDFHADEEAMVERIQNAVSALLALLEVDNDPLKSKPHILISNIIEHYWRMGRSVSIGELIVNLQKPPIRKLGIFDVDQLMPEKERSQLAFEINNIIAAPGFRFWTSGAPLSAAEFFRRRNGRNPVNIFYIAHLSDSERMFFVTLLLNEVLYWMRSQPGSGKLKALLYMDEIFGYLPPYPQNPPSKKPLMFLLKQARAFGLGVMLATQNPKDIDYKALTNMGTWFVGKLQADGDRERVMEGITGVTDASGAVVDSDRIKQLMSGLSNRRFLVKNVHEPGVKVFQSRWAMSYLAGPLTRLQLKTLNPTPDTTLAMPITAPVPPVSAHMGTPPQPSMPGTYSQAFANVPPPAQNPGMSAPFHTPPFQNPPFQSPQFQGSSFQNPSFQNPSFQNPSFQTPSFQNPSIPQSQFTAPPAPPPVWPPSPAGVPAAPPPFTPPPPRTDATSHGAPASPQTNYPTAIPNMASLIIQPNTPLLSYVPQSGMNIENLFEHSNPAGRFYTPRIYMEGEIIFDDQPLGVYIRRPFFTHVQPTDSPNWRGADFSDKPFALYSQPLANIQAFAPLDLKLSFTSIRAMQNTFRDYLFNSMSIQLFVNKELNLVSSEGETREAFLQRCRDIVERTIDKEVDKIKDAQSKKIARYEDRVDQEKLRLKRLEQDHKYKQTEEIISIGESVLGMFLGGRSRTGLSSAARRRRSTSSAAGQMEIKKNRMEQMEEELSTLQQELEDKTAEIEDIMYEKADNIQPLDVRLEKNDIIISRQAIVWILV